MEILIWAKTEFEGWHKWKDAPGHRAYLGTVHRHMFKVVVTVSASHDDRQVEFHDLKDMVEDIIAVDLKPKLGSPLNEAEWSCEQMALHIAAVLTNKKMLVDSVSVSEDGECGARIRVLENVNRQR